MPLPGTGLFVGNVATATVNRSVIARTALGSELATIYDQQEWFYP